MYGHWYVIASRDQVKVLSEKPGRNRFRVVHVMENPLGREKSRAFRRDRPGREAKPMGGITIFASVKKRTDPQAEQAQQFAKGVCQWLEQELHFQNFYTLTVCAPPNFLGIFRSAMSSHLRRAVRHWIPKDFQKVHLKKLEGILLDHHAAAS